jgi:tetrahydrodipicolinate N-succinyltransferase
VFLGGNHRVDWISTYPFEKQIGSNGDVNVGNDVWIGHGVTIMSGINIGDGAVIAANSHVVRNVEPYSMVGGNPAKLIKYRFDKTIIDCLLELQWWDLSEDIKKEIKKELNDVPEHSKLISWIEKYKKS